MQIGPEIFTFYMFPFRIWDWWLYLNTIGISSCDSSTMPPRVCGAKSRKLHMRMRCEKNFHRNRFHGHFFDYFSFYQHLTKSAKAKAPFRMYAEQRNIAQCFQCFSPIPPAAFVCLTFSSLLQLLARRWLENVFCRKFENLFEPSREERNLNPQEISEKLFTKKI